MLRGEKILITGPAGQIAFPLAEYLAADNEVWGIARFGDPTTRSRVDAAGIKTRVCDLASGDFGDLPQDFDYVLHLATYRASNLDYDRALAVNAEGTQLLLHHCRTAKAALVMSTFEVYKPQPDPWHVYTESDPLGDANSQLDPTYSISKIAQEAVARACARTLGLPVVIPRMNASYGPNGGLLAYHLDFILSGQPIRVRWDPAVYSPIHQDDINAQVESVLAAATVPATVINWAGDEPVTVAEWAAEMGKLTGRDPTIVRKEVPGGIRGILSDNTRRLAITGPCRVDWRDGVRRLGEQRQAPGTAAGPDPRAARLAQAASGDASPPN